MLNLTEYYQWFHHYYSNFYSSDPDIMRMVELKENHSIRVAKNARDLAEHIGLPLKKINVAELIGLFHDIARSEQAHLKTFNDSLSFDHGDRGVVRLEETGILDTLDIKSRENILFSIKYHNKMTTPSTSPDKMLFTGIIKDADKLDIFRILPPIVAEHDYSPILIELLKEGRVLPYSEIKTMADKRLIRLGWIYDINYQWTLAQLVNEGYVDGLIKALPDTPQFNEIKDHIKDYIAAKMSESM
ncbi:HD domain-containing protein [Pelosinus sp. sgz500959]|uniref:HD domain-containing protein n=1 Tax=Pelosinus sp. sgz500959 TaxID=3242472 RepID=UPI0036733B59